MKYLVLILLAVGLYAQQTSVNNLTFTANSPAPVTVVSASVNGNTGISTYYYWVIAKYPRGNASPSGAARVFNAPNTLTAGNYVNITWSPQANATSYDLIRSTSPQLPTSGNIAVATSLAATTFNDVGGALSSYTVTSVSPASETWYLDNTNCSVPIVQTPSISGNNAIVCTPPFLRTSNNLSDLANAGTARTNLGLTSTATTALSSLLLSANNLSDLGNAGTSRTNLGLTSTATTPLANLLQAANNLSDLGNVVTARVNLGLANTATTPASTFLQVANNLSDISNATTARGNLGLASTSDYSARHFLSTSGTPTITGISGGLGTSPSAVTISGTDSGGRISFTTGTSPAANAGLFTINFASQFGTGNSACIVNVIGQLTPAQLPWISGETNLIVNVASNTTALTASTAYTITYHCSPI